ncbi:MAG: hypothetical protein KIT43_05885 [Bauldia sp.]|nr:hypothetical protein [Bauldia sp.]
MIIRDLQADEREVAATVVFERSGGERRSWVRRREPVAGYEAFAVAFHRLALQSGEGRILVEGPLDPVLAGALATAGAFASHWWGFLPMTIEATSWHATKGAARPAASFFTGGIDSLFTLHRNLRSFPAGHPWRIGRGLLAYRFDAGLGGHTQADDERPVFDRLADRLAEGLAPLGVEIEVVDTNFREGVDFESYMARLFSGFLIGMAHASGPGVYRLASAKDVPELRPHGSHPSLDDNTFSTVTRVIHDGHDVARLDKLSFLRDWQVDLSLLHVCWETPIAGPLNCGRCHKCRRTLVELAAVGLEDAAAGSFVEADLDDAIATLEPRTNDLPFLRAAAARLRQRGRPADALETSLRRYDARLRRAEERDWRGPPKRLLRSLGLRR